MNRIANKDESTSDALGGTLSLADTLEEDRKRYQDVIRDLNEFEEALGLGEVEVSAIVEEVRDMDAKSDTPFA